VTCPVLTWQFQDNNTKRARKRPLTWYLFAGVVEVAVVTPSNSGDLYSVYSDLPSLAVIRWKPLVEAKEVAELMVRRWFEACFAEPEE
jgi:hypothetical protein